MSSGLDYDDHALLDEHAKADLLWISDNITRFNGKPILEPDINVYIESDASLTGWGHLFKSEWWRALDSH